MLMKNGELPDAMFQVHDAWQSSEKLVEVLMETFFQNVSVNYCLEPFI